MSTAKTANVAAQAHTGTVIGAPGGSGAGEGR